MKHKKYPETPEVLLFGLGKTGSPTFRVDEISINIERTYPFPQKMLSAQDVADFLRLTFRGIDLYEEFICIYLNKANIILGVSKISSGGISGTVVDIRLILGIALKIGASSIIVSHNHPSGIIRPSDPDIKLTTKLKNAAKLYDIALLDHLIIASEGYYSFANEGDLSLSGIGTITIQDSQKTNKSDNMKKVTRENFGEAIQSIDQKDLPEVIRETIHELKVLTSDFTDWSLIDADKELSEIPQVVIDYLNKHNGDSGEIQSKTSDKPKPEVVIKPKVKRQPKPKKEAKVKKVKAVKPEKTKKTDNAEPVETLLPEVRIIKRYIAMDGKKLTREKILTFITTIQRLIRSHAIRKTSKYADEIMHIQKELIKAWHKHKNNGSQFSFELDGTDAHVKKALSVIASSQKPMETIKLIKRYLSIQGKQDVKEKAKKLNDDIIDFNKKPAVSEKNDKYLSILTDIQYSLMDYINDRTGTIEPSEQALSGLQGLGLIDYDHKLKKGDRVVTYAGVKGKVTKVMSNSVLIDTTPGHYYAKKKVKKLAKNTSLDGCPCVPATLGALTDKTPVISASEFKNIDFRPVGYSGKWLSLIGDPVEPFMLMCWSKPGKGKSTLMIEFAQYLANEKLKRVLFVSKEEGLNHTLKDKFFRMNAFSPNIFISESIPADLSLYDYVFFDSVNQLQLSIEDVAELKKKNPNVSFMLIFQATVDGSYRGTKDFEHLVDVSVNINDQGYASAQKTRFGGNGTINVFKEDFEEIYKFTNLQDAEKFRDKKKAEGVALRIVQGDDMKIWVVKTEKAEELYQKGFTIL